MQVYVHVPGHAELRVSLPFGVDARLGTASTSEDGWRLLLRLPFKSYRSFIDEVRTFSQQRGSSHKILSTFAGSVQNNFGRCSCHLYLSTLCCKHKVCDVKYADMAISVVILPMAILHIFDDGIERV